MQAAAALDLRDARSTASALLPFSGQESDAVIAWARVLLSCTISALEARGELTATRLRQVASVLPADEYADLLAGTHAEALCHPGHEDLLAHLRETVANALERTELTH